MGAPADDVVDLLDRRRELLARLTASPPETGTLVETTDYSRSTVDRAVRELRAAGLVERRDDGLAATTSGRLALDRYGSFLDETDGLAAARSLLDRLPADAPMAADLLPGAAVHLAEPPQPDRAYEPLLDLIEDSRRICGLSPALGNPETGRRLSEVTTERELPVEFVFQRDLADHLWSAYADDMRAAIAEGGLRAFAHPSIPYGLGIGYAPDRVRCAVLVYEDSGKLAGVIVNDAPAAVGWAERVFLGFRAGGTELPPPGERE